MPTRAATKRNNPEKDERQGPAPDPTQALSAAMTMFDDEFEKLNLHGKISAISGWIGRIPKNGWNKFNSYAYVLESDLVEYVRYWLAAARILVFPESFREHTVYTFDGVQTGSGKQRDILTDSIIVYRVIDGRSGETFTYEVNAQGSDPRDKGANKASTSAMKFGYLRLFNIASGEDEAERDETGDRDAALAGQGGGVAPVITDTKSTAEVQRGGKETYASKAQIQQISHLSNQLSLGAVGLVGVIKKVLDKDVELPEDETKHGPTLAHFLKEQTGEEVGKVIVAMTGMVAATNVGESDGA